MTAPRTPPPSVRVDKDDSSKAWIPWLIGLLLLALLALILFFVLNDDGDDDLAANDEIAQDVGEDEAQDELPAVDASEQAVEPTADASAGASTGPVVLALPFGDLASKQGQQVTGSSLEVVDVPADEAFTIGSAEDELLVYITTDARTGESGANVEPGSTVSSLQGTLEPVTDEFLSMLQLTEEEAAGVRERGVYVAATAFELAAA